MNINPNLMAHSLETINSFDDSTTLGIKKHLYSVKEVRDDNGNSYKLINEVDLLERIYRLLATLGSMALNHTDYATACSQVYSDCDSDAIAYTAHQNIIDLTKLVYKLENATPSEADQQFLNQIEKAASATFLTMDGVSALEISTNRNFGKRTFAQNCHNQYNKMTIIFSDKVGCIIAKGEEVSGQINAIHVQTGLRFLLGNERAGNFILAIDALKDMQANGINSANLVSAVVAACREYFHFMATPQPAAPKAGGAGGAAPMLALGYEGAQKVHAEALEVD